MLTTIKYSLLFYGLIGMLLIPHTAFSQDYRATPEAATGYTLKSEVRTKSAMVVAANPLASKAGLEILNQGGNAIDAAIATQLVLNLVEPQSSGIGGGGFLMYWENCNQNLVALDGRETAPLEATKNRFLTKNGQVMGFKEAAYGRRSIGTPGLVKLMATAHHKYGRLQWQKLFAPAIRLAEDGFPVSPRLHKLLKRRNGKRFGATAKTYFYDNKGRPRPIGYLLKNPAFAASLTALSRHGEKAFYQPGHGLSHGLINKVWRASERNISFKDLASYQVKKRPPLCNLYRGYKICGMGPPSSGAIVLGQALKMFESQTSQPPASKNQTKPSDKTFDILRLSFAEKLAYADRKRYIADPAFVKVPKGLLDNDYLQKRAKLIPNDDYLATHFDTIVQAGKPPLIRDNFGEDETTENDGTSHISIIDSEGNVLALTSTIEAGFGSGLMTGGFLLNNELTDFSFKPLDNQGKPIANSVAPGKRPRSSMTPTIIFDPKGKPFMTLGSPGGSRIPLYVLKTIIAVIDWDMTAQQAVSFPNFGSRNKKFVMQSHRKRGGLEIEKGAVGHALAQKLQKYRLPVSRPSMNSGIHLIIKRKGYLEAGIDPRREGHATGF